MFKPRLSLSTVALLAALAGGAAVAPLASLHAQATDAAPKGAPPAAPDAGKPARGEGRLDRRIAHMKEELKLTAAQEPQFEALVQVMRQNGAEARQAFQQFRANRQAPVNAEQRLAARAQFAELRAKHEERLLAAFRPLYQSLTPDQQKTADHLLARHGRR